MIYTFIPLHIANAYSTQLDTTRSHVVENGKSSDLIKLAEEITTAWTDTPFCPGFVYKQNTAVTCQRDKNGLMAKTLTEKTLLTIQLLYNNQCILMEEHAYLAHVIFTPSKGLQSVLLFAPLCIDEVEDIRQYKTNIVKNNTNVMIRANVFCVPSKYTGEYKRKCQRDSVVSCIEDENSNEHGAPFSHEYFHTQLPCLYVPSADTVLDTKIPKTRFFSLARHIELLRNIEIFDDYKKVDLAWRAMAHFSTESITTQQQFVHVAMRLFTWHESKTDARCVITKLYECIVNKWFSNIVTIRTVTGESEIEGMDVDEAKEFLLKKINKGIEELYIRYTKRDDELPLASVSDKWLSKLINKALS